MNRGAFTLVELLISLAIGLLLVSVGFAGFQQARKTIDRTQKRLEMHQRSSAVYRGLRADLTAMMPDCAMFVRSIPDDPATPDSDETAVELVFMRGKIDMDNFDWGQQSTWERNSEMLWTQWRWDRSLLAISAGANRWQRSFQQTVPWVDPSGTGSDFKDETFYNLPQPRRVLAYDPLPPKRETPWDALDGNVVCLDPAHRAPDDVGDGTDLRDQTRPAIRQVSAFRLDLVMSDGSVRTYDGGTASTDVFAGIPMDGTITRRPSGDSVDARFRASEIARRPRLARFSYTLAEPRLALEQRFSVSVALPGILPGPPP